MDVFRTGHGRDLEYLEVGDPGGRPVVYLPGTPGTAGCGALFDEAARRHGVRMLAISRPGYGASTTTPPGLVSVAHVVGELMTALGVDEFSVLSTSGGGPFALAAGAVLPTRVRRLLVAASPGPADLFPPEVLESDAEALDLLAAGEVDRAVQMVTAGVQRDLDPVRRLPRSEFEVAFRASIPPSEHYFDSRPAERRLFFDDLYRALETYDGFVRDNLSWLGQWDFDLGDVVVPVSLSYGDADAMVPPAHGEWIAARLRAGELTIHAGADHGTITFGVAESMLAEVP